MSATITFHELRERTAEVLDRVARNAETVVVQRDGEDYAVILSPALWHRHQREIETVPAVAERRGDVPPSAEGIGHRLDALGPEYRLGVQEQQRAERLLLKGEAGDLQNAEREELEGLLAEADEIMQRRAKALERVPR